MVKLPACISSLAMLALTGCGGPDVPQPPPAPPTPQAVEMSVTFYHCGLDRISYQGKKWEAGPATLFDDTNKPASWRGHGTITEVGPTHLLYRDDSGLEVTFLPDGEVPPGRTCA